jgi:hypothetical protein
MIRARVLRLAAIVCLLSVGLSACTPKATTEDIIGCWVEHEDTASTPGPAACGTFEFDADGRFVAHDIQERYFLDPYSTGRISGSGKWQLDASSKDPFAWDVVVLEFDPIPEARYEGTYVRHLYLSQHCGELTLFAWSGDENIRNIFVKRDKAGCE